MITTAGTGNSVESGDDGAPPRRFKYTEFPEGYDFRILVIQPWKPKPRQAKKNLRTKKIQRGKPDETIVRKKLAIRALVGEFINASLDNHQSYEAMSYVWGPDTALRSAKIRIWDDHHHLLGEISITQELQKALRRLRHKSKVRYLWVDALCINQGCSIERTAQMKIMDQIYQHASHVCVWLGGKGDDSDKVPNFVRKKILNLDHIDDLATNDHSVAEWRAFATLLLRPWFSRRWCVQEITFAQKATVYVGSKSLDWQDFADAVTLFSERSEDIIRLLSRHDSQNKGSKMYNLINVRAPGAHGLIETLSHLFRRTANGIERLASMETLLSMLSSYDVTVPRDAIYAILKLGKDTFTASGPDSIVPNYEKSTLEVYVDLVKFAVMSSGSLDIICMPWAPALKGNERIIALPSWVAAISRRAFSRDTPASETKPPTGEFHRRNADSLIGRGGKKPYSASSRIPPIDFRIFTNKDGFSTLYTRGRWIGEINLLEDPVKDGIVPFAWLDIANSTEHTRDSLLEAELSDDSSYESSEEPEIDDKMIDSEDESIKLPLSSKDLPDVPEAFWRTLVANRGPNGGNAPTWYRRSCQKSFRRPKEGERVRGKRGKVLTEEEISLAMVNSRDKYNRPALQFLRRVQAATWNRRFMLTKGNSMGLAPASAKLGDYICILWGCSVPVVLRKHQDHFKLIGECYIHGIMDGELLSKDPKLAESTDARSILFKIR